MPEKIYTSQMSHDDLAPKQGGVAVTPNNTTPLPEPSKALWVGGTGNLTVTMLNGEDVTFTAVPAGEWLDIAVTHVKATGTNATNIVALW